MSPAASERLVFGEWLVRKSRLDQAVLKSALEIQNAEKSDNLRSSPRLLGQILLDDFQVFRSRIELSKALVELEAEGLVELVEQGVDHPHLPRRRQRRHRPRPRGRGGDRCRRTSLRQLGEVRRRFL